MVTLNRLFRPWALALGCAPLFCQAGEATSLPPQAACASMQVAEAKAADFLALLDAGNPLEAREIATGFFREQNSKNLWLDLTRKLHRTMGKPVARKLKNYTLAKGAAPYSESDFGLIDHEVSFANGTRVMERVMVGQLPLGECGVIRYQIDTGRLAITAGVESFAQWHSKRGLALDFSMESLNAIEIFFIEHAPEGEPLPNGKLRLQYAKQVEMFGHYLGEVIIRQNGGHWSHAPRGSGDLPPLVILKNGRRFDSHQAMADFAKHPGYGGLRHRARDALALATPAPQEASPPQIGPSQ